MTMTRTQGSGIPGKVMGAGLFALWIAHMTGKIVEHCDEYGMELPFPEQLREYPVSLSIAMQGLCNRLLPDGVDIRLHFVEIQAPPPHKHFDRHGAEIPCETYHYLHDRNDYGIVGHWESDSGNTHVNTLWIGDEGCLFETRVFSTDPQLDGRTMDYASEAEAECGHAAMISIVQSTPPVE